jgi:uncharacterized protein (TIGR02452 family)
MGRTENVIIFQDTQNLCRTNKRLADSLKNSIAMQKIILETESLPNINTQIYDEPAKIIVTRNRTFEAALSYKGQKTAVHNFASASNPGGGVVNGATAQEECLCRCSDLYDCLNVKENWDKFYGPHRREQNPIHNDDIIYTPNVIVFKSDTPTPALLDEKDWYNVDVITCAAPNLRETPSNRYNTGDGKKSVKLTDKELLEVHEKRLRRILDLAVLNGVETIILGAFGCGAFYNNPNVVARAAKNVTKEYTQAFRNIEFAVYCSPRDDSNYKIFERILRY